MSKKLSPKQDRFCKEYLVDFNATQAAIRAGYSQKTAYSIGQENLKKPEVQARIAELVAEKESALICSADEALQLVSEIARGQTTDEVFRMTAEGGQVHDVLQSSTKDRLKALEIIMKVNGMFEKNVNLTVDVPVFGGEDELAD